MRFVPCAGSPEKIGRRNEERPPGGGRSGGRKGSGGVLLSHAVAHAVSSALRGLTAVFGMGTGVALSAKPPENRWLLLNQGKSRGRGRKRDVDTERINTRHYGQVERPISTSQLKALQPLHLSPINVVIYHGSSGRSHLGVGFPLICFQRLSVTDLATQRCPWQDNWYTRGQRIPVLSY